MTTYKYNGFAIQQRDTDGYVCITDMCKAEGKLVADYLRLTSTKEYLEALSEAMGIPIGGLVPVINGVKTFAHPYIAMDCAQWVSPSLRIWANKTLVQIVGAYSSYPVSKPTLSPTEKVIGLHTALIGFGVDLDNPRFKQGLQDLVLDLLLPGVNTTDEVRWLGVVELAEELGYTPSLVVQHRATLGKYVASNAELEVRKEHRLCNGTQRLVNLYADCDELRSTIREFMDAKILSASLTT